MKVTAPAFPQCRRGLLACGLSLALLVGFSAGRAEAKIVWKAIRPAKASGKVCVRVGNSDLSYYKLDKKAPVEFTLHGPGKVKLATRHLPRDAKLGKRSYTLIALRDGKEVLRKKITANRSTSATLCDKVTQAVGAARESRLTIPAGRHVFRVYLAEEGKSVAMRVYEQEQRRTATHISYAPAGYERVCTLLLPSGKTFPHYHATAQRPVRFTVQGPTALIIRPRLDAEATARGVIPYGIEILRNSESHRIVHLKTRKEEGATYRECPGVVPSESGRIDLKVPAGSWTYELRPADARTSGFAVRIMIPKDDVGPTGGISP